MPAAINGSSETELKKMKTSANLKAHSTASISGKLITTIPVGTEVSISTENSDPIGDWARIIYKNAPAFVASKYLVEVGSVASSDSPWNSKDAPPPPEPPDTPTSFLDTLTNLSTANKLMIAGSVVSLISLIGYATSRRKQKEQK